MGGAEVRRMCLLCVLPLLPYIARKLLDWLVTGCRLFWLGRSALSLCTLPAFLTLAFFSMSPPIYKKPVRATDSLPTLLPLPTDPCV